MSDNSDRDDEEREDASQLDRQPGREIEISADVLLALLEESDSPESDRLLDALKQGLDGDGATMEIVRQEIERRASFHGPLPPPSVLHAYDQVYPGLKEIIVEQWTSETGHRRKLQVEAVRHFREVDRSDADVERKLAGRGQWFGLIIAVLGLLVAGFMAYLGHPGWGAAVGALDLVALVVVFVRSQRFRPGSHDEHPQHQLPPEAGRQLELGLPDTDVPSPSENE